MTLSTVFSRHMSALGPFEPGPHLAVAVSGGSDSLALALLAQDWARAQGGRVTALSVDHGLRNGSRAEVQQVGRWLRKRGIAQRILTWEGEKPKQGLMAAARQARYRLLEGWCARKGVLHLLLAHQIEDQAETLLMRLARGSGADGLAGMASIVHARQVRLLRPLLGVKRADLKVYLKGLGQAWIDDPSNDNQVFERVRLRAGAPVLADLGLRAEALAASAAKLTAQKRHLDIETVAALARHAVIDSLGFAWVERALLGESVEIRHRCLARLLACLNGETYLPAMDQVERLGVAMLADAWRGGTLAGCRLLPRQGRILIVREVAACAPPLRLVSCQSCLWDGRWRLTPARGRGLFLGALGGSEAQELARQVPRLRESASVPFPAWASLPAIRDARGVSAVPGLGYKRNRQGSEPLTELVFAPRRALTGSNLLLS